MKLAYGYMLHDRPDQFAWLHRALANETDVFAIHVDARTDDETLEAIRSVAPPGGNIQYVPRCRVLWGGWGVAAAELRLIEALLHVDPDWHYFINLSGSCYPLTDRSRRVATLSAMPHKNLVEVLPLTSLDDYVRNRVHLHCEEVDDKVIQTSIRKPLPTGFAIDWAGANWHILTREFCQWLVSAPMAQRICAYFRDTRNPDEHFIQCAIMNSPFRETVMDYRREIRFQDMAYHPDILGMADWPLLATSHALFARKFDARQDREILGKLAQHIGASCPEHQD